MINNLTKFKPLKTVELNTQQNKLLDQVLKIINSNQEIQTLWLMTNVMAVKRMGITDHGIVHFKIVANYALQIARLLAKKGVKFSIVKDYGLSSDYAELVIVLASLMHDLGMSVNRHGHEEISLFLVNNLLHEILNFMPVVERTIVISETLHAIIGHRKDGEPITIEAGIVRVADALDMSEGRTRMPYEEGKLDIHSVSAKAIDKVEVNGEGKALVQINIDMNHTAGLFQIDELLEKKVKGSGIEKYLDIKIFLCKGKDKKLFKDID